MQTLDQIKRINENAKFWTKHKLRFRPFNQGSDWMIVSYHEFQKVLAEDIRESGVNINYEVEMIVMSDEEKNALDEHTGF